MTQTEELIRNDLLRINQSKIKRLTKTAICPQKYYDEEISGEHKRETTEYMLRGHYMEYKLWGTIPKEGKIPILPGGRAKGSISVIQERLDQQVETFPKIMEKHGIRVIRTNYEIEVPYDNRVIFYGTLDSLVEYNGKPYIMDLKTTANVQSTFGDFAWGKITEMMPGTDGVYVAPWLPGTYQMDMIQAHAYMYLMERITRRRWGFLYTVFDYKPKPEHKIIEVPYDDGARADMIMRLDDTKYKLNLFKELNYRPIPSDLECEECKRLDCAVRLNPEQSNGTDHLTQLLQDSLIQVEPMMSTELETESIY
jgi:hypothetical protein